VKEETDDHGNGALWSYICHGRPERCFWYKGKPLPLCARCLGFYLGVLIGFVTPLFFLEFGDISFKWIVIIVGCTMLPFVVDGTLQYSFNVASNNPRRFATGILAGIGLGISLTWLFLNTS